MTYSYSAPLNYGQQQPIHYDGITQKQPSSIPYGIGGLTVGAIAGGIAGSKVNPFVSKSGVATDSFTGKVLSNLPEDEKKVYNQCQAVLKSMGNAKNTDELTTILTTNKEAAEKVLGNTNEFMKNVTDENLSANKKVLKNKFNTEINTFNQDIKNKIQACWKKDGNKFEKVDSVKQEVFDAIKNSTKGAKTKLIAKYAAIAGVVTGAAAFIAHKIFLNRKNQNQTVANEQGINTTGLA